MIGVNNMCGGGNLLGNIARIALASATMGTSEIFGVGQKVGDMFGSKPKTSAQVAVSQQTSASSAKESEANEAAVQAREEAKKKAAQMLGRRSTILTGSSGLTDRANTTKKTLLGA